METQLEKRMREIAREEIAKAQEAAADTTAPELFELYKQELKKLT